LPHALSPLPAELHPESPRLAPPSELWPLPPSLRASLACTAILRRVASLPHG
jgi:hypothetical protein